MPRIILDHEAPQRSERWYQFHIGLPTASEFSKVVTPAKLELSKQRSSFSYRLAAERLLNQSFRKDLGGLEYIEVGKQEEDAAVQQYHQIAAMDLGMDELDTYRVSMILTDDGKFGCSPDRLIAGNERHGLEIKAIFPPKLAGYLFEESTGPDHRVQVLGQMWVGDLEINDLYCYNKDFPSFFKQWKRKDTKKDIETVGDHMTRFGDELEAVVHKLNATGFFQPAARPITVLDALVDAMVEAIQTQDTVNDLDAWASSDTTEANLRMLDAEQREKVRGMVAHKKDELKRPMPGIQHGWGG